MGWKYIMMEITLGKGKSATKMLFPVIFPDKMVHIEVATVVKLCGPLDGNSPRPVSAGSIEHIRVDGLGGESTTLGLKTHKGDELIINSYSYTHGVK